MKELSDTDIIESVSPLGNKELCSICGFKLHPNDIFNPGSNADNHIASSHNLILYITGYSPAPTASAIRWYWHQKQRVLR